MRRRGVILPVVLFVLVLIGLLAAMFSFRVYADLASTQAVAYRFQTRLAAEAGVERVKMLLRTGRLDRGLWYHNPELLNRVIVTAHGRDAQTAGTTEEFDESMVYRFSIVADDPNDDKEQARFGITDESAKLNLNVVLEKKRYDQLLKLVAAAVGEDNEVDPQRIVDAIVDWYDSDSQSNGEDTDTEGEYYRGLPQPYRVKNGPFDSIEELLLVKGVTPEIFYGEDFDRNGLVSENEKDGDKTFPPDNRDDILNRGLYPYLTVLSTENNTANDNRPRVNLLGEEAVVRAGLETVFPEDPGLVDGIVAAVKKPTGGQGGGGGTGGAGGQGGQPQGGGQGGQPQDGGQGGGQPQGGGQGGQPQDGGQGGGQPGGNDPKGQGGSNRKSIEGGRLIDSTNGSKLGRLMQQRGPGDGQPSGDGQPAGGGQPSGGGQPGSDGSGVPGSGDGDQGGGLETGDGEPQGDEGGDGGTGGGGDGNEPTKFESPASVLLPRMVDGQPVSLQMTNEQLAVLMDRTTTTAERGIQGLININTAPRLVLSCIEGMPADTVEAILSKRGGLTPMTASTTAWLVTELGMDVETYAKVAPQITARGQQFTIESVGFGDHIGMVTRLQVIVDMNGPIVQTIYYRDISGLGGSYPIREEDKEKIRGG